MSNPHLHVHAQNNRRHSTAAVAALWQRLRGKQLGVWFRRQVPLVGRYVADFYAPGVRLVVEVDGHYHATTAKQRADRRRTRRLEDSGIRVVRVANELVLSDIESALGIVRAGIVAAR